MGGFPWAVGRWGGAGSDRRPRPPPHPHASLLPGLPAASPAPSSLTHATRGAERPLSHASLISSSSKTLQRFSPPPSTKGGVSQVAQGPQSRPIPSWPCSATATLQTRRPPGPRPEPHHLLFLPLGMFLPRHPHGSPRKPHLLQACLLKCSLFSRPSPTFLNQITAHLGCLLPPTALVPYRAQSALHLFAAWRLHLNVRSLRVELPSSSVFSRRTSGRETDT